MEELIRTKLLTGESKERFDKNFEKIFGKHKPNWEKRVMKQRDGYKVFINFPQGEEKCKLVGDQGKSIDPKQMDGFF